MQKQFDIEPVLKGALQGIKQLAQDIFKKHINEVVMDSEDFLRRLEPVLKSYATDLSLGVISKEEFESLVMGEKDLFKIKALKNLGITQIRIEEFKNGVLGIVSNSIFSVLGL